MKTRRRAGTMMAAALAALLAAASAQTAKFTGASPVNNLFSNTGNWDIYPTESDNIFISADNTSAGNPAIVDPGFTVAIANFRVHSDWSMGSGMAYAEVASNGVAKTTSAYVGNTGANYTGTLVLRKGGTLENRYGNSGALYLGGGTAARAGYLVVEPGAVLKQTMLTQDTYGELTFEFGADTVTPLQTTRANSGGANTLDGMLRLDLADLAENGAYTLIDSSSDNLQLTGALKTWLDAGGGSRSGTGDDAFANFEVTGTAGNANWTGSHAWTLTTADGGRDLVFTVIPEPATLGLIAVSALGAMWLRRLFVA